MEITQTAKATISFAEECYKVVRIKMETKDAPGNVETYQAENQRLFDWRRNTQGAFWVLSGIYAVALFKGLPRVLPVAAQYPVMMGVTIPVLSSTTVSLLFSYDREVLTMIDECPRSVHAEVLCMDMPYLTDKPVGLSKACQSYYQRLAKEGLDPEEVPVAGVGLDSIPFELHPIRAQLDHPEKAPVRADPNQAPSVTVDDQSRDGHKAQKSSSSFAERLRARQERRRRQEGKLREQDGEASMEGGEITYTKEGNHKDEEVDLLPPTPELEKWSTSRGSTSNHRDRDGNADYFFESDDEASDQGKPAPGQVDEREQRRSRGWRRTRRRRDPDNEKSRPAHDPNVMNLDDEEEAHFR